MLKRALNQEKEIKLFDKSADFEYLKCLLRRRFDELNCKRNECLKIIELYEYFGFDSSEMKSDLKTGH